MFDWKLAIFALQLVSTLITIGIFCIIKFNDLKHLSIDMKSYSNQLNRIFRRLGRVEHAITKRDAICELQHKYGKKSKK